MPEVLLQVARRIGAVPFLGVVLLFSSCVTTFFSHSRYPCALVVSWKLLESSCRASVAAEDGARCWASRKSKSIATNAISRSFHVAKPNDSSIGMTGIAFMPDIDPAPDSHRACFDSYDNHSGANGETITATTSDSTSTSSPVASGGGLAKGAVAGVSMDPLSLEPSSDYWQDFACLRDIRSYFFHVPPESSMADLIRKERIQPLPPAQSYVYPRWFSKPEDVRCP